MNERDYDEFALLLDGSYDLIGSGVGKVISISSKAMFFASMANYSIDVFRSALSAHCLDPERGRFTPKPADIIMQINASVKSDDRPGAEEAWAVALTSQDETDTVVWTTETAEAFNICRPVLDSSGAISARKTFIEAYTRIVLKARQSNERMQYVVSEGDDKTKRVTVLRKACREGLITHDRMVLAIEHTEEPATDDIEANKQIEKIRQMMLKMNFERQLESDLHLQRERDFTADAKARAARLVDGRLRGNQ